MITAWTKKIMLATIGAAAVVLGSMNPAYAFNFLLNITDANNNNDSQDNPARVDFQLAFDIDNSFVGIKEFVFSGVIGGCNCPEFYPEYQGASFSGSFKLNSSWSGSGLDSIHLSDFQMNISNPHYPNFHPFTTLDSDSVARAVFLGGVSPSISFDPHSSFITLSEPSTEAPMKTFGIREADVAAVPEPTTMAGLAVAGGLGALIRKKKRQKVS